MKKLYSIGIVFLFAFTLMTSTSQAQIYEPEGLNMPGTWNSWVNPPTNRLVLANPNQAPGGMLARSSNGITQWSTRIHVAASGGDTIAGTYTWIFTSGPTANYFTNKWASVIINMDELQTYTYQGADDNEITLLNDKWYSMVWEDLGYMDSRAIFMVTSEEPVLITSVSEPTNVNENEIVDIDFTISDTPCAEEIFYLQYTTNGWANSNVVSASLTGTNGSVSIPGQAESTVVEYNIFSSTVNGLSTEGFLYAMEINDNNGSDYTYTIGTPLPDTIGWANLQWPPSGEIMPLDEYIVYAQAFIYNLTSLDGPLVDLQAWVGYSSSDSDPSTWTNWVPAAYLGEVDDNDEYSIDLGALMSTEGTYYYATRFQYLAQDYVYGGFSDAGGGFWDGVDQVSGVLTVTNDPSPEVISWANLQYPASGEIEPEAPYLVYGQAYIENVTNQENPVDGLQAWIGYSDTDNDPSTWTDWIPASFSSNQDNNDEYEADLGFSMPNEGTFYYATRFKYLDQEYVYGGYSESGGNFWDGADYVSGILNVEEGSSIPEITWANLQYPPYGEIEPTSDFVIYGQVFIENMTSQEDPVAELQAWIGYGDADSNPSTWTDWFLASFSSNQGNNDEYELNLGAEMDIEGIYYYATRYKYLDQDFVYGGYSEDGGNFWDGEDYISGVLTVTEDPTPAEIGWANLQWPPTGSIQPSQEFLVYSQTWIEGITYQPDSLTDLQAWIGYSTSDSDPGTWTNWVPAYYLGGDSENDEYDANIGALISSVGTYYYATRFKYQDQDYVYGGYSDDGGGFWDGSNYVSGELNVSEELIAFPVSFTVSDATGLYNNIKFKGEMTDWNWTDMQQDGTEWSLDLEVFPGSYEWGVLEDDGSADGIWLVIEDNLVVTIAPDGSVSGDTYYVITYVGLNEWTQNVHTYPNPVQDYLFLDIKDGQGPISLMIMDAIGNVLQNQNIDSSQNKIDFSHLSSGVYFLQINDRKNQTIIKIIKQ